MKETLRHQLGIVDGVISFIMACAPDRFPVRDYLTADQQPNLDSEFERLRAEFEKFASDYGDAVEIMECRKAIEEAYQDYLIRQMDCGSQRIQEVLQILMGLRKQKQG